MPLKFCKPDDRAVKPTSKNVERPKRVLVGSMKKGIVHFSDVMNKISEKGNFVLGTDEKGRYFLEEEEGCIHFDSSNDDIFCEWSDKFFESLEHYFEDPDELELVESAAQEYLGTPIIPWDEYNKNEFLQKVVDLFIQIEEPRFRLKTNSKDKTLIIVCDPCGQF